MSKIIILIEPAEGHFNPFVPIIKSLLARGHDIVCITGSRFQQRVERIGVSFYPLPAKWDPGEHDIYEFFPDLKHKKGLAQIKSYLKHIMYAQVPDTLQVLKTVLVDFPADVVISDTFMVAGNWVTELGGPPSVRLSVISLSLPGKDIAPFGLGLLPGKSILTKLRNNLLKVLFEKLLFKDVQRYVNRIRTQVGLPVFDKSFFIKGYEIPNLVLHTSIPSFEYHRDRMPDNFRFIGATPAMPSVEYNMPAWWSTVNQDLPIILLNQGTVAKNFNDLIYPAIAALKDKPVNVIIVPASASELPDLPSHMYAESYIPFGNLLPHIDIVISNGGQGGVQIALAHGIPVIVAGATEDKMETAARVANSGAGINLGQQQPSEQAISKAVDEVLHHPVFKQKAESLQAEYAKYDAEKLAVEAIEQLIKETK